VLPALFDTMTRADAARRETQMERKINLLDKFGLSKAMEPNHSCIRLRNFTRVFVRGRRQHEDGVCLLLGSNLPIDISNGEIHFDA
jgi:hypothetical protein